jgi:hypothetical protein
MDQEFHYQSLRHGKGIDKIDIRNSIGFKLVPLSSNLIQHSQARGEPHLAYNQAFSASRVSSSR